MRVTDVKRWDYAALGDLAVFRNGVNYNKGNFGKGIKVINVKDFQDYSIASYKGLDEINPHGVVREESLLQDGDILFVRSNGNRDLIGRSLFIRGISEPVTHSAFTIRARIASRLALPRFYAYLFRSSTFRRTLSARGSGTNISNLNQDLLSQYEVPVPPVETQRKIAAILSAYDDLIENNTRWIKILEEMAQALYREWFVHFRFPGHEKVKMVPSPLGPIPVGWDVGRLDDALILQRGFDLPIQNRRTGSVPIYAATGVVGTHDEARVSGPGIVTGRSGSLGTVIYVDTNFWPLNTTLWVKEFRRATPALAFFLLTDLKLDGFNSGAAVPTLNRNDIHGLPVVLAPSSVLSQFDECVLQLFALKKTLQARNANLRRTRDLLLPKLISGEIDVSNLDRRT